jgi:DNA repair exonuclease SbcCD ATPase subunit
MNGSNGRQGSLYEQTLEYARREIDEASAQISRLREHLSYLEARMEAAKSVYEAVAARLNIEDESVEAAQEEIETRHVPSAPVVSREEISRLLHPQEPSFREAPPPASPPSREPAGLSTSERDLIRQHLEARGSRSPEPAPVAPPPPPKRGPGGGLSDEDRRLIEEHLRRRVEAERQSA